MFGALSPNMMSLLNPTPQGLGIYMEDEAPEEPKETVYSRHNRAYEHENSQKLWQHAELCTT